MHIKASKKHSGNGKNPRHRKPKEEWRKLFAEQETCMFVNIKASTSVYKYMAFVKEV